MQWLAAWWSLSTAGRARGADLQQQGDREEEGPGGSQCRQPQGARRGGQLQQRQQSSLRHRAQQDDRLPGCDMRPAGEFGCDTFCVRIRPTLCACMHLSQWASSSASRDSRGRCMTAPAEAADQGRTRRPGTGPRARRQRPPTRSGCSCRGGGPALPQPPVPPSPHPPAATMASSACAPICGGSSVSHPCSRIPGMSLMKTCRQKQGKGSWQEHNIEPIAHPAP